MVSCLVAGDPALQLAALRDLPAVRLRCGRDQAKKLHRNATYVQLSAPKKGPAGVSQRGRHHPCGKLSLCRES